ncbi:hypothetical protein [Burkholderia stagnalis]|uniref:hypothetical protein n=1 Tax=Burkholderia stagnalis TaxID=1503054 RepID=UPI000F55CF94|nr:hypothetical protein [Burkholderia stagnalis]
MKRSSPKTDAARAFLRELLPDGVRIPCDTVYLIAEKAGINRHTLSQASKGPWITKKKAVDPSDGRQRHFWRIKSQLKPKPTPKPTPKPKPVPKQSPSKRELDDAYRKGYLAGIDDLAYGFRSALAALPMDNKHRADVSARLAAILDAKVKKLGKS